MDADNDFEMGADLEEEEGGKETKTEVARTSRLKKLAKLTKLSTKRRLRDEFDAIAEEDDDIEHPDDLESQALFDEKDQLESEAIMAKVLREQQRIADLVSAGDIGVEEGDVLMNENIRANPLPAPAPTHRPRLGMVHRPRPDLRLNQAVALREARLLLAQTRKATNAELFARIAKAKPAAGGSSTSQELTSKTAIVDNNVVDLSEEQPAARTTTLALIPPPPPQPQHVLSARGEIIRPSPFEEVEGEDVEILEDDRGMANRVYPEIWIDTNWKIGVMRIDRKVEGMSTDFDVWYIQRRYTADEKAAIKAGKQKPYYFSGYMRLLPKFHQVMRKIVNSAPDRKMTLQHVEDCAMDDDGVIDITDISGSGYRRTKFKIEDYTVQVNDVMFYDHKKRLTGYEGITFSQKKKIAPKKGEKEWVEQTVPSRLGVATMLSFERIMQIRNIPAIPMTTNQLNGTMTTSTPKREDLNRPPSAQTLCGSSIASVSLPRGHQSRNVYL